MKPAATARGLLPEHLIQTNLDAALESLFAPQPPSCVPSAKVATRGAGFKIMAHQIRALHQEADFWEYLVSNGVKVIVCLRHNRLMQHISDLITTVTKQSACWDGQVRTAKVTVAIEPLAAQLLKLKVDADWLLEQVRLLMPTTHRVIYYEEFKTSLLPVASLAQWLVDYSGPLTTKLSKQNPEGLRARVTNYDQIVAELARLGLSHWVEV